MCVVGTVNKVKKINHASGVGGGSGVVTMWNVSSGCDDDEQGEWSKYDGMNGAHNLKRRKIEREGDSEQMRCNSHTTFGIFRFGVILAGMFWGLGQVPTIFCVPMTSSMYSKDTSSSTMNLFERTAFDLFQRASGSSPAGGGGGGVGGGGMEDLQNSKSARDIFPRRNMWELISASSDTVPLRSHLRNNNGSSQFLQWPGGGEGGGSGGGGGVGSSISSQLTVETRLERLQHHFNSLRVFDEDCRQRLLCEIAESPHKFAPLTNAFLDETSFNGDEKSLASKLLETNDGARLLTYIEATQRGISRQGCEIWTYRCPRQASTMIDFKSLLVWREMSKWLTVKFVAKKHV